MTAVEWLEQIIKSMVINGGDLGEDYPALLVHIQQAKKLESEQRKEMYLKGIENYDPTFKLK